MARTPYVPMWNNTDTTDKIVFCENNQLPNPGNPFTLYYIVDLNKFKYWSDIDQQYHIADSGDYPIQAYNDKSKFPKKGESGIIYQDKNTGKKYTWSDNGSLHYERLESSLIYYGYNKDTIEDIRGFIFPGALILSGVGLCTDTCFQPGKRTYFIVGNEKGEPEIKHYHVHYGIPGKETVPVEPKITNETMPDAYEIQLPVNSKNIVQLFDDGSVQKNAFVWHVESGGYVEVE